MAINQRSLLPLDVLSTTPAGFGTSHLSLIARTHDGQDWAAKTIADHPLLPISEYLGYRLAEAAQIGVPYWHILRMPDGSLAFGSRFEGAVVQWSKFAGADQDTILNDTAATLSRMVAFDWFYGNMDRHANNVLFRLNRDNQWTALALDFSQAGPLCGFPFGPALPLPPNCNTELLVAVLRSTGRWQANAARLTVASLQAVDVTMIEAMLADAPDTWFDNVKRAALLQWWQAPARNARLLQILSML